MTVTPTVSETTAEQTLHELVARFAAARSATDVFGRLSNLISAYRHLAKLCHPDHNPHNPDLARTAFVALHRWRQVAEAQLAAGSYDEVTALPTTTLSHRGAIYEVDLGRSFSGDFSTVYRATVVASTSHSGAVDASQPVAVKVARTPRDNELIVAERAVLRRLWRTGDGVDPAFQPFLPRVIDGFTYEDTSGLRATNVLSWAAGAFTLADVTRQYPGGISPKDVAWIWRRLLGMLGAVHRAGVVHGAVLPDHVAVVPQTHALVLLGWTCAGLVADGHSVPAVSAAYDSPDWYPQEVMQREPATPATDIAMGARCMLALMTGTAHSRPAGRPEGWEHPEHTDRTERSQHPLAAFFRGCCLPAARSRPQDAWALLREFDDLIERLWGERRLHRFTMPGTCPR